METWYEKAQMEIEEEYSNGNLTGKEFQAALRDLHQEYDEYAREAAENLYNSFY